MPDILKGRRHVSNVPEADSCIPESDSLINRTLMTITDFLLGRQ
jgi:hypothetical protein